jgi:DNA-binding response OmpR family regulator
MALVLLIDDDPLVADVVSAALGQGGHTLGVLGDGIGALKVIELKRPAVVLLDCAMPGLPGVELLRQIRSSRLCFDVPVLMLTARSQSTDRDIAMRAGATGYMIKPFECDRLLMRVDEIIGSSCSHPGAKSHGVGLR